MAIGSERFLPRLCALVLLALLVALGGPFGGCPCRGGSRVYLDEDFEGCTRGACPWGTVEGRARLVSTIHANQVGMSLDRDRTAIRRRFEGGLVIGGNQDGYYGYGGWPSLTLISSCVDDLGRSTLSIEAELRILGASGGDQVIGLPVSCDDAAGRYHGCSADLATLDAGEGLILLGMTVRTSRGPCVIDRLRIAQGVGGC